MKQGTKCWKNTRENVFLCVCVIQFKDRNCYKLSENNQMKLLKMNFSLHSLKLTKYFGLHSCTSQSVSAFPLMKGNCQEVSTLYSQDMPTYTFQFVVFYICNPSVSRYSRNLKSQEWVLYRTGGSWGWVGVSGVERGSWGVGVVDRGSWR